MRKFVLDTNCFIAASRNDADAAKFEAFVHMAAPGLYLSTVVAAELRAGTIRPGDVRKLERAVLKPYYKRGRIINPSAAAWNALGKTLAWLVRNEGVDLRTIRRSFIFDILLAAIRLRPPRILRDLILAFAYIVVGITSLDRKSTRLNSSH